MNATLVLTGTDVRATLDLDDCIRAVERALALRALGQAPPPATLGVPVPGGGFHVKAAAATLGRPYFVAKTNANLPGNPARHGLPTVQGVLVLCDAERGHVLALMDSIEITTLRTGAATAVAAKHLARPESSVATVIGCGVQGRIQLQALSRVLPLRRVFALDVDETAARRFADEMSGALGVAVTSVRRLDRTTAESDVWVTCTPARRPLLGPGDVGRGAFVAAVGADHPEKQELHPDLFRDAKVVVDVLDQCLTMGDLHHAVAAGAVTPERVHAELGAIAAGLVPGRTSNSEVIVFDSTGTALEDVAAAAIVYERSIELGRGRAVALAGGPTPDAATSGAT